MKRYFFALGLSLSLCLSLLSCSQLQQVKVSGVKAPSKIFRSSWAKNLDKVYSTGNLPIALNSPLVHNGIVYIGNNNGYMQAYELQTGKLIWSKKDSGSYHAAPVVWKEAIVYGTTEGRVYARHLLTGKALYQVDLDASVESQGVIYKDRIFFHLRNHKLFALDVSTGKILWGYKRSVPMLTTLQRVSKPLLYDDKVFVGFADGSVVSFSMEDGNILWDTRLAMDSKFVDVDSSPIIFNNKLVVGPISGPANVLNIKTGEILQRLGFTLSRAPLILSNGLLAGTVEGEVILLDEYFKIVQSRKISQGPISSITPWKGGYVVTTTSGNVTFLNGLELIPVDGIDLGSSASAIFGPPVIEDKKLVLFSSRNRLYVFE